MAGRRKEPRLHKNKAEEGRPEAQRKKVGPVGTEECTGQKPEFQWELVKQGRCERNNNQPRKGG